MCFAGVKYIDLVSLGLFRAQSAGAAVAQQKESNYAAAVFDDMADKVCLLVVY